MDMNANGPNAVRRPVALITGASRGLGATLARFLARTGYDLVLAARGVSDLETVAEAAAAAGSHTVVLPGDVADGAHRQHLVAAAEALGRLDLLVNNASALGPERGPSALPALVEYPLDALRRVLEVNLVAPLGLIQAARSLLAASGGLIVNVSSDAAVGGYPGWGGYGASKAGLDLVSRTLAAELRADGIGVVAVDPGDMCTAMHKAAFPDEDISDRPAPDVTLPFFAWLLGQDRTDISGGRFEAQADRWLLQGGAV